MISLEQIRLLESRITRAIDLIRVLKEENSTLRKGLESAQKRMKELESLVEGFKADQQEIETVILRTLHSLDDLEEGSAARRQARGAPTAAAPAVTASGPATPPPAGEPPGGKARAAPQAPPADPKGQEDGGGDHGTANQELDIF